MNGQTILITGASKGIGKALVEQLANTNTIIALGRDKSALDILARLYPNTHPLVADLADPDAIAAAIAHIRNAFPQLSVVINNAGIQLPINFNEISVDMTQVEHELAINLYAPITLIHGLLPLLKKQPKSLIVNITSVLALTPKHSTPIYCATKAALHNFTQSLRYQLRDSSVTVAEVFPPVTRTDLNKHQPPQKAVTAEFVAEKVVAALDRGRTNIAVGKAALALRMHRWWPEMLTCMLIKH